MMSASIFFWLLLPLPGYALVRRFSKDDLESGLMGTVAISYLYTLGVLSPVAIVCYVLRLPVGVLSGYLVLLFVAGLIDVARQRAWRDVGRVIVAALGVELVVVLMDMVLGARAGTFLAGDAFVHLSRIRHLLDHGMNNDDPFVAARHFFPVYHTNLLHALYAVCAQVTQCDLLDVWFDSLPMGKLLIAAGSYYMAWCVFRRNWAAWVAVMFVVGVRGPFQYVVYPNQLSPYFLTPMLIGILVSAVRGPCAWRHVVQVGVASLVIGQFHGLYVLFSLMAIGPVVGVVVVVQMIRRRPGALRLLACAAAMWVGFPFILVSKWQTPQINRAPVTETATISNSGYFVRVGAHDVQRNPANLVHTLGGGVGNTLAWFVGIGCALTCKRRKEAGFLIGIITTCLLILFVPQACSFFLRRLGEEWVMQRFDFIIGVCQIALVPGAIAAMIERVPMHVSGRMVLSGVTVLAGAVSAGHEKPDDWKTMWQMASAPEAVRKEYLRTIKKIQALLKDHIPKGETILTDSSNGIGLVAISGNPIVVSERASNGVPDQYQRKADLAVMLSPRTPWEQRIPLFKKYNTRYFYPTPPFVDWVSPNIEQLWTVDKRSVIKLKYD
jgi:hypothetical protein